MENVAIKVSENVCLKIIKKDNSGLFWLLQDKTGKLTNRYVLCILSCVQQWCACSDNNLKCS